MAFFDTGSAGGGLANFGAQTFLTFLNNSLARRQADRDRYQNWYYNEQSADAADARTRALYNDFYSPEALMRQYKAAGLSPALMFGGTPGQGGTTGAQGHGVAGIQTPFMPMSMVEAAQAAALFAQADKTKEESKNVAQDTKLKELQQDWQEMQNTEKSIEFKLTTFDVINPDGSHTSLYEIAQKCNDFDVFMKKTRTLLENANMTLERDMAGTEQGQKIMRRIYLDANRFDTDISILSSEKTSAEFQEKLLNILKNKGYLEQSAEVTIKQLKAAGETADLTAEQKGSWNRIIKKLEDTNSTAADIIVVLAMILNQAASNWEIPQIHTHNNYRTTNYVN